MMGNERVMCPFLTPPEKEKNISLMHRISPVGCRSDEKQVIFFFK